MSVVSLSAGIFLALLGTDGFSVWVGMELNMMGFLPLIVLCDIKGAEASLKYLLVQFTGSFLFLASFWASGSFAFASMLMLMSLSVKAGCAPFHFWVPEVSEAMAWGTLYFLLMAQKVVPLGIMESIFSESLSYLVLLLASASMVFGVVSGAGETKTKKILGFSSIGHLGWVLVAILLEEGLWLKYFICYCFLVAGAIFCLSSLNQESIKMPFKKSATKAFLLVVSLLSLGGVPPFWGFVPKLFVILKMAGSGLVWLSLFFAGVSAFTIFYYLRMGLTGISASQFLLNAQEEGGMAGMVWGVAYNFLGMLGVISVMSLPL
uniref:NADH-ubiquinone oxidoreductase chain 2 n=1 Tax=Portunion sp. TaxID=2932407 RepID=A0A977TPR7_9CRUS|nr:NADH dehydrogenase subunit 2 [Portunion sp.]